VPRPHLEGLLELVPPLGTGTQGVAGAQTIQPPVASRIVTTDASRKLHSRVLTARSKQIVFGHSL
jgi:hypothetical protein